MRLETLEFLKGRKVRIGIIQPDNITDRHLIAVQMIEERPAIGVGGQRPADRMPGCAGLRLGRVDVPQLLDADGIGLRVLALTKIELVEQRFCQMPTAPFGKNGLFRAKLHATHIHIGLLAILADPHIAGGNAANGT